MLTLQCFQTKHILLRVSCWHTSEWSPPYNQFGIQAAGTFLRAATNLKIFYDTVSKFPNAGLLTKNWFAGESGYAQKLSKWIGDCKVSQSSIKWITAYQLHYNCTKSTKIGEFPFKLLCERIPTKIGANENKQCFFCKENLAKSHWLTLQKARTCLVLHDFLGKFKSICKMQLLSQTSEHFQKSFKADVLSVSPSSEHMDELWVVCMLKCRRWSYNNGVNMVTRK